LEHAPGNPHHALVFAEEERRGVESLVFVGYGPVSGSNLTLGTRSGGERALGGHARHWQGWSNELNKSACKDTETKDQIKAFS
jgi:hypothetical protein